MARINIEDSLFKDTRWSDLLLQIGCKYKALGLLTTAWILAQNHWLKHKSIPQKAWPKDLDVLIKAEFANVRSDGSVYVKGSKRAFSWLDQKSDAGQRISEKKLSALKKARSARWNKSDNDLNGSERTVNGSEALSLSLSPSLTLSQTHSQENIIAPRCKNAARLPTKSTGPFSEFSPKKEISDRWVALYSVEYVDRELIKIPTWLEANPRKNNRTEKGWIQFVSNWLERGWSGHLKQIPVSEKNNQPKRKTFLEQQIDSVYEELSEKYANELS